MAICRRLRRRVRRVLEGGDEVGVFQPGTLVREGPPEGKSIVIERCGGMRVQLRPRGEPRDMQLGDGMWWRERAAGLRGCVSEIGVPTDERDRATERQCARQMNGVVAAQLEPFGEIPGFTCELRIHRYPGELALNQLELGQSTLVRGFGQTSCTPGCPKSRAALGVGEDARRGGVRARP